MRQNSSPDKSRSHTRLPSSTRREAHTRLLDDQLENLGKTGIEDMKTEIHQEADRHLRDMSTTTPFKRRNPRDSLSPLPGRRPTEGVAEGDRGSSSSSSGGGSGSSSGGEGDSSTSHSDESVGCKSSSSPSKSASPFASALVSAPASAPALSRGAVMGRSLLASGTASPAQASPPAVVQTSQHRQQQRSAPIASPTRRPVPTQQKPQQQQTQRKDRQHACEPRSSPALSTSTSPASHLQEGLPPSPQPPSPTPRRQTRGRKPKRLKLDHSNGRTILPLGEVRYYIGRVSGFAKTKSQSIECTSAPLSHRFEDNPTPRSPAPPLSPPPVIDVGARPELSSEASSSTITPTMGNQSSRLSPNPSSRTDDNDSSSVQSVLRSPKTAKAMRVPGRSSVNMLKKRPDSKVSHLQLPNDFSATVVEVPRASTAPNLDAVAGEGDAGLDYALQEQQRQQEHRHKKQHSAPSSAMDYRPASTQAASPATIRETALDQRPLSSQATITEPKRRSHEDGQDSGSPMRTSPPARISALSPTLPAPSPLPEDSPHKYGLKDRMDSPELQDSQASEMQVAKARRRSSGVEVFNEARSLQNASSFLNGLSTARRRAESRANSRAQMTADSGNTSQRDSNSGTGTATTYTNSSSYVSVPNSHATSRTASRAALDQYSHYASQYTSPNSSFQDLSNSQSTTNNLLSQSASTDAEANANADAAADRHLDLMARHSGQTHKSSGFAYSRPLTLTQLKCFRNHERLLPSRNKNSPVECAVCHVDDEGPHWSCSWCAVRMCRFCREDFGRRGQGALRERVRMAEMGDCSYSDRDGRGVVVY